MEYQTEFKAYSFYNKQGQRLAIFGKKEVNKKDREAYLDIFILRCSDQDRFEKSKAEEVYKLYQEGMFSQNDEEDVIISRMEDVKEGVQKMHNYHPLLYRIPLKDGNRPRKEFMDFCLNNYFRKVKIEVIDVILHEEEVLV